MILRTLFLGFLFWVLTLAFPAIYIAGFWTIVGSVVVFALFNIIYNLTIGILVLPLRIVTFDIISWLVNTGIVYLLADIFNNFTIEPNSFGWVFLFTGIYTLIKTLTSSR